MNLVSVFFTSTAKKNFKTQLHNVLGIKPNNMQLFEIALSHRSVKENAETNNERLEYLGDAILGSIVADYLFKRYPYKGEGFLTEMRSKMVNRQRKPTDGTGNGKSFLGTTFWYWFGRNP